MLYMFPHLRISKDHRKQYTSLATDSKKEKKNKTQLPKKHKTKPNIFSTMQLFVLARSLFMQSTLNSRYLILLHT